MEERLYNVLLSLTYLKGLTFSGLVVSLIWWVHTTTLVMGCCQFTLKKFTFCQRTMLVPSGTVDVCSVGGAVASNLLLQRT